MNAEDKERWHVNKEGVPGVCNASVKPCPFKEFPHQDTKEDALRVYEETLKNANWGREFTFPKASLEKAIAAIKKANRKAERAGISERFEYSITEHHVTKTDSNGFQIIEDRVSLRLNTPSVSHDGWDFVGKMEWDEEAGLITKLAPGQTLTERPENELCDVCNKVRHRNNTYIVRKGDEQRQVGSNCLKQFMGISPAGLWMLDFEEEFKEDLNGGLYIDSGYSDNVRYSTKEILAYGLAITNERGWVSKSMEAQSGALSTSSILQTMLSTGRKTKEQEELLMATRINSASEAVGNQLEDVLASVEEMKGETDFTINLRKLAKAETVSSRNIPLLLSAIGVHQAANRKKIEKKLDLNSQWQGTKGEKVAPGEVTVTSVRTVPNYSGRYGAPDTSTIISFRDTNGNVYKSFYSGSRNIEEGETLNMTNATVKDHSEWNGVKETMITRIKVVDVRPKTYPSTKLKESSPFAAAWTVDELSELRKKASRELKAEMKKKAGKGGWDRVYDVPYEPQYIEEYEERRNDLDGEYEMRYQELE